MGYMHIANLYRSEAQTILLMRKCFALEKIHGTSAHISWVNGKVQFSSGGENRERFVALFDEPELVKRFESIGHPRVTVYGEAYGGKQQAQSWRYGKSLKFVAFEVRIEDSWLNVPNAEDVVTKLGLEFVHYTTIETALEAIDAERDAPSEQARRNGVEGDQPREGVVLRPIIELRTSNGNRIMSKHKRAEERETRTDRKVGQDLTVISKANDIAFEWVTPTRLQHVLDKMPQGIGMESTRDVIQAMTEDVFREGAGEFEDSKQARKAIATATAEMFHKHLRGSGPA